MKLHEVKVQPARNASNLNHNNKVTPCALITKVKQIIIKRIQTSSVVLSTEGQRDNFFQQRGENLEDK